MDQFLNQLQSPPPIHGGSAVEEAYMNGFYDGLKLRALLNQGSSGSKLPSLVPVDEDEKAEPEKKRRRLMSQRVSEKARDLQKLLPSDEKMDMATGLGEAYKYIKFLQAQVTVLQNMPREGGGGGDFGAMSRQEALQVFVNSPAAQKWMYANGCCVYAVEQLAPLS